MSLPANGRNCADSAGKPAIISSDNSLPVIPCKRNITVPAEERFSSPISASKRTYFLSRGTTIWALAFAMIVRSYVTPFITTGTSLALALKTRRPVPVSLKVSFRSFSQTEEPSAAIKRAFAHTAWSSVVPSTVPQV